MRMVSLWFSFFSRETLPYLLFRFSLCVAVLSQSVRSEHLAVCSLQIFAERAS